MENWVGQEMMPLTETDFADSFGSENKGVVEFAAALRAILLGCTEEDALLASVSA